MNQLNKRQKQALATKLNITEKAMELIKTHGLDSVKVTDICESANISVGTFYHHFNSKEDLIENAYMKIDLLVEKNVEGLQYDSSYDKIIEIFRQAMKSIEELGYKFMADIFKHIVIRPPKYSILGTRYPYNAIKKAIEEGINSGEFISTTNAAELSHDCMRIGRGLIFDWCLYEGNYSLSQETERLARILLNDFVNK